MVVNKDGSYTFKNKSDFMRTIQVGDKLLVSNAGKRTERIATVLVKRSDSLILGRPATQEDLNSRYNRPYNFKEYNGVTYLISYLDLQPAKQMVFDKNYVGFLSMPFKNMDGVVVPSPFPEIPIGQAWLLLTVNGTPQQMSVRSTGYTWEGGA